MRLAKRLALWPACALAAVLGGLAGIFALSSFWPDAAGATSPAPDPAQAAATLPASPKLLARFHERLTALASGQSKHAVILQIGDSHTAADYLTGRLRQRLQARFGNGGRGLLPPGVPYPHYRAEQLKASQMGSWQVLSSNKPLPDAIPFGVTGYALRSTIADDAITIEDRSGAEAVTFGFRSEPASGSFEVIVNGETYGRFETAGQVPARQELRLEIGPRTGAAPPPVQTITLRSYGDGPLEILDVDLSRSNGLQVVNLGFIGAQIEIMRRWHWPTVREQLAALDPALIVVAFGTNEGFAPAERIAGGYEAAFEQRLTALQAAAPLASMVVLGPPQAARYPRFCLPPPSPLAKPPAFGTPAAGIAAVVEAAQRAIHAGVILNAWPPAEPPETAICKPLSDAERQRYDLMLSSRDRELCRWHTPPALPLVREIQRRVAARLGLLFVDWSALFDGECGIDRWARQGLAAKDRVHFKEEGYTRAADALHDALLAGFAEAPRRP